MSRINLLQGPGSKQSYFGGATQRFFSHSKLPIFSTLEKWATDEFARLKIGPKPLEGTLVYIRQHMLWNSIPLARTMSKWGVRYSNMYYLGIPYSANSGVIKELQALGVNYFHGVGQLGYGRGEDDAISASTWRWKDIYEVPKEGIDKIIAFDHGGKVLQFMPPDLLKKYKVVAGDKTTTGIDEINRRGKPPFPVIDVASCAIKKFVEPPFIAEAVFSNLDNILDDIRFTKAICSVIGFGPIGKAIAKKLLDLGCCVFAHDIKPELLTEISHPNLYKTVDPNAALSKAKYIFFCTKEDITNPALDLFRLNPEEQVLINCTSGDYPVATALRQLVPAIDLINQSLDPYRDVIYTNPIGGRIVFHQGGYPANFGKSRESGRSVDDEKIDIIRSLALAALVQAVWHFHDIQVMSNGLNMLDAAMQVLLVKKYLQLNPGAIPETVANNLQNPQWIREYATKLDPNVICNTSNNTKMQDERDELDKSISLNI
ncbi:NAD(P)-dependent oxidoreductase [Legionella sp.]|uniref:NAD(P)-dependent oxidoreductase n=1 Tax=Legionella sp. TaxID=459 RepID=UPI00321F8F28